ncbi:hypothetical protein [Xylophilus sp. GOD-11R]|nr:hypothetical protein [Xylophilus sp. GOD-11R]WPB58760.1 hypothetical protein R9X41_09010 [Xylophilus sp. GOD-11R]
MNTSPAKKNSSTDAEPGPPNSEDSVPQDEGTDNRWQMEPLENRKEKESK